MAVHHHSRLVNTLVAWAAGIAGTLFFYLEYRLEFDELVLLVWCWMMPLLAILQLMLPVILESLELQLYLLCIVVLPLAAFYTWPQYVQFDEAFLFALCVAPVFSVVRMVRSSLQVASQQFNRNFWQERLPELFMLLCVGVLPVAASSEFGLMQFDDATLLFYVVLSPIVFGIHNSPALKAAREALTNDRSLIARLRLVLKTIDALIHIAIAVAAPIYGMLSLQLELDEVVLIFPCGVLAAYCLVKVALAQLGACMWGEARRSTTLARLSGSMRMLIVPAAEEDEPEAGPKEGDKDGAAPRAKNGTHAKQNGDAAALGGGKHQAYHIDYGDLTAAEEAIRRERRSRHGAATRAPSAPTTPRVGGPAGTQWHHRNHHWGAQKAPDKIGHLPDYFLDPLAPAPHHKEGPRPHDDKKKFSHKSHSLAATDAGPLQLPDIPLVDHNGTTPKSSHRFHQSHHLAGDLAVAPAAAPAKKEKRGLFGWGRSQPAPVPEGRESRASFGSESSREPSPAKSARKGRSNSFSLSPLKKGGKKDGGGAAAGGRAAAPPGSARRAAASSSRAPQGEAREGAAEPKPSPPNDDMTC